MNLTASGYPPLTESAYRGRLRLLALRQMGIRPLVVRNAESGADSQPEAVVMSELLAGLPPASVAQAKPASLVPAEHQQVPLVTDHPGNLQTSPLITENSAQAALYEPEVFPAAGVPAQPFAFSWIALDQRLAVLVMLPAGEQRLSAPLMSMLSRLVAAIHADFGPLSLRERVFSWPLADVPGLPADQEAAGQAADGFLARLQREQQVRHVLVLADVWPFFLAQPDIDGLAVHERYGFVMLRVASLQAMQNNNDLKRAAWQAMQPLIKRLRDMDLQGR